LVTGHHLAVLLDVVWTSRGQGTGEVRSTQWARVRRRKPRRFEDQNAPPERRNVSYELKVLLPGCGECTEPRSPISASMLNRANAMNEVHEFPDLSHARIEVHIRVHPSDD
jgi:hypothetical protein